jgi:hypothetical protein
MEQAGQDVAPELVSTQQVQMSLFDPKQMSIRLDETPHFVWVTLDEEIHGPGLTCIFLHLEQERLGVHGGGQCIGEGAQMEFALGIDEVQNLRSAK